MRWQNQRESNNVEDRRGLGGRMPLRGLPVGGKVGALLLVGVIVAGYFGFDLSPLLNIMGIGDPAQISATNHPQSREDNELARFTGVVLGTTERTWSEIFSRAGRQYSPATLVLYSGATDTACGYGESATGPFYCPADNKVYIDLSFYHDMRTKLGGGGDFALGYVLAHEIGHHVQNQLGLSDLARRKMQGASKAERNRISVQQELQADCLAGVWGHQVNRQGLLETGDLEEALNTANAIGDDRLQRQSMGRVVPDSFTHGSSRERMYWFKRGFDSGDVSQCDTGL